ncbi:MAG: hypothetical protein WDO16_00540 [Bacteroidota bacterium]
MRNPVVIYISSVIYAEEMICDLLENSFQISAADTEFSYRTWIKPHFERLQDDCWLLAETPYVDRVYRDSYYHYYSSKHASYLRDCIRISIFQGEIQSDDFRRNDKRKDIQDKYRAL